jgi:hypothetical protein
MERQIVAAVECEGDKVWRVQGDDRKKKHRSIDSQRDGMDQAAMGGDGDRQEWH